jgi:hypothetical protein
MPKFCFVIDLQNRSNAIGALWQFHHALTPPNLVWHRVPGRFGE